MSSTRLQIDDAFAAELYRRVVAAPSKRVAEGDLVGGLARATGLDPARVRARLAHECAVGGLAAEHSALGLCEPVYGLRRGVARALPWHLLAYEEAQAMGDTRWLLDWQPAGDAPRDQGRHRYYFHESLLELMAVDGLRAWLTVQQEAGYTARCRRDGRDIHRDGMDMCTNVVDTWATLTPASDEPMHLRVSRTTQIDKGRLVSVAYGLVSELALVHRGVVLELAPVASADSLGGLLTQHDWRVACIWVSSSPTPAMGPRGRAPGRATRQRDWLAQASELARRHRALIDDETRIIADGAPSDVQGRRGVAVRDLRLDSEMG